MVWLLILLIIIFLSLLVSAIEIVSENTVYVVELLGKFSRVMTAGLNFRVPLLEKVSEKVTLKQQNFTLTGRYQAKDKATVDIAVNIIFAVMPTAEAVRNYAYSLVDREKTIEATIENSLRASIAVESYDDVLKKKEVLTNDIKKDLDIQFKNWGIEIISFQIMGVRQVITY